MGEGIPVEELDEDLLEYLEGANAGEQALRMCPSTGKLRWWIPKRKGSGMPKWRILDAPHESYPHHTVQSCERKQRRLEMKNSLKLRLSSSCGMLPLEICGSKDGRTSPV